MKWFWLLLAAYVLTLSAVPCCGDDACCEEETELAANHDCMDNQEHEHEKPELPCSPFFSCNTCHGVVITSNKVILSAIIIPTNRIFYTPDSSALSIYQPAVWHPPKA